MAYANQVIGGGDGEAVARAWRGPAPPGIIVADLTPDEGAAVRGGRAGGRPRGRLPRGAHDPAGTAGRDRGPERRVPLLRLARRRDRRPDRAAEDRRPPRQGRDGGIAGPGRRRVRRQQAGPRPGHRQGRRRRRDRRLGARRRARRGRPRRRRARPPGGRAAGRDRSADRTTPNGSAILGRMAEARHR